MSITIARDLRDEAMDLHEQGNTSKREILTELKRIALRMALDDPDGQFAFEDVRESLALPLPADFPTAAMGSVMRSLANVGAVKRVGFAASSAPANHAHAYATWQLDDVDAAQEMLATL